MKLRFSAISNAKSTMLWNWIGNFHWPAIGSNNREFTRYYFWKTKSMLYLLRHKLSFLLYIIDDTVPQFLAGHITMSTL